MHNRNLMHDTATRVSISFEQKVPDHYKMKLVQSE